MVLHIRVWESSTAPEFLLYPGGFALLRGFFMPGKYLLHDFLTRQAIDGYPRTLPCKLLRRHLFAPLFFWWLNLHDRSHKCFFCITLKGKVRA